MSRDKADAARSTAPAASTPATGLTMRASVQWAETLAVPSQPAPVNPTPESLGDGNFATRYETQHLLGQGGMGEVQLCRDGRIGRDVATKVMHPGAGSSSDAQSRFLREVRIQGQLEHPSIVPVYDLGRRPDGTPYFTMKRVRGLTLEQILAGHRRGDAALLQRFPPRKLLGAFIAACLAVHFAHSRGVIHRDLKPANLMLGDFGEVYVLDWGLAKILGAPEEPIDAPPSVPDDTRTAVGQLLGTPGYMAPEQIEGPADLLDGRADVYSLGAILFEILALEPLHPRTSIPEILSSTRQGIEGRPSLRASDRDIPPEIDALCARCTAQDRDARYASVREVEQALQRFLDGDRDLELRRTLAEQHASAAARAAERALSGHADALAARREAVREVSRTLALDPSHRPAMQVMARLLVEPPRSLPPEAAAELKTAERQNVRISARAIGLAYLSWLLFVPVPIWLGVRVWLDFALLISLIIAAAMICLLVGRKRAPEPSLLYACHAAGTIAIAAMSGMFGHFILVPVLAAVNTIGYAIAPELRRGPVIAIGCLAVALPAGTELLGLIPPPYVFHGDVMAVVPLWMDLPPGRTWAALLLMSIGAIIVPALSVGRIRTALRDAEHRLQLHAWHLRQLIPGEALDTGQDAPGADRAGMGSARPGS